MSLSNLTLFLHITVCSSGRKKSKWHIRKELEEKGSIVFVRSFKETCKEGGEDVVTFWGIAEAKGLFKIKEKGKDEHDGKDNALAAVFRFLNHMVSLMRDFKRQYSPAKSTSSVFEFLQQKYPTLIQVEKKSTVRAKQPLISLELLHVATFRAMLGDNEEAVAMEAASKGLLDLLLKMSKWKERVFEGSNSNSATSQTTDVDKKKSNNVNSSKQVQLPKTEVTAQKAKLPLLQTPTTEIVKVLQQPNSHQLTNNKQPKPVQQPQQIKQNQQPAQQPSSLPSSSSSNQVFKSSNKAVSDTKKQVFNGGNNGNKSQPTHFKGKAQQRSSAWKNAQANNSKKAFFYKKQKNGSSTNLSIAANNKKSYPKNNVSSKQPQTSTTFTSASPLSSNFGSQDELRETVTSTKTLEAAGKQDNEKEARLLIPVLVNLIAWYNSAVGKLTILYLLESFFVITFFFFYDS